MMLVESMECRGKCAGTVKAKEGQEALLEDFWKANAYVAGRLASSRERRKKNYILPTCPQSGEAVFKRIFSTPSTGENITHSFIQFLQM